MLSKILVVDDWHPNLILVEKYLRGLDMELVSCLKSTDAKKLAKNQEFALCILDIQMPDVDGFELAEYIRSSKKNSKTPIIFLTGVYADTASIFKGYEAGAVDYLTKPIKREVLIGKVKVFVQLYQQKYELQQKQLLLEEYIEKLKEAEKSSMKLIIEGEDREKIRIASELHDGLGQYLSAALMNFNSIKDEIGNLKEKSTDRFANGLNFLNHAIIESRNLTGNLIPKIINDFGLIESLDMLVRKLNEGSATTFKFIHKEINLQMDKNTELHCYRMCQECLNNIIKHANANQAVMHILGSEEAIHITCEDDGKGFVINAQLQDMTSYGLQSLYHRTKLLDGNISIESKPGKGTMISIDIPLTNQSNHEKN